MNSEVFSAGRDSENWASRLSVLDFIAGNAESPAALLREVFTEIKSQYPISVLLEKLALNPNADIALLQSLSDDVYPIVRACVAKNPNATSLMWKFANDESTFVRYELATTDHFPEHLYESLASDKEPRVAARAKRTLRAIKRSDSVVGSIADMVGSLWHHRKAS
jgi:hypothetical protein